MSGKHTSGPWHVVPRLTASENHRGYQIVAKPKAFTIAQVVPMDEDGVEGGANARLIAAAPELLEACKRAYANMPEGPCANELREVIAKVEQSK